MDPSPIASTPVLCDEVRLLTYIRPHVDLDQPRSGHDGLFARQLPIALSGSDARGHSRVLLTPVRPVRHRLRVLATMVTLLPQSGTLALYRQTVRFINGAVPQHRPGYPRHLVR